MKEEFTVTAEMLRKRPEMAKDGWKVGELIPGRILHARYSRYMQRVAETAPWLVDQLANVGARFTHHTSIAPTGTISLSLANNASATASSRRSRITISATSSAPARRARRKSMSSHSSCWPIASSSIRVRCRTQRTGRTAAWLFHDGR